MDCSKCSTEIPNNSLFCPECGTKQEPEQIKQTVDSQVNAKKVFCINCGSQILADSRFCPECRAKQINVQSVKIQPQVRKVQSVSVNKQLSPEEEGKLKKRNKIIGIVAGAVLVLCVIIIAFLSTIKPSINLNNYMTISFEGYDTLGKVVVTFDTEKIEEDYEKKLSNVISKNKPRGLSKYKNDKDDWAELFDYYDTRSTTAKFLSSCVNGKLDKTSDLSNGDVVTYSWDCDDETALAVYGYKLKYEDIKVTVENLEEAKAFDPFEGIEVVFEGIGPNGSAHIDGEPTVIAAQDLRYEFDKNSGLSNGDSVTVTASLYYDDPFVYCIQNYGMIPSTLTKTYKVDGLDSYVNTISDISEESLERMQVLAKDVYNNSVAQNFGEGETLKNFSYIGNYLLVKNNNDNYWDNNNVLYLVYKAQVKDKYSSDGKTYNETNDVYWYICFYDLLVNTEGVNTVDLINYRTPRDGFTIDSGISSDWWSTKSWYYYGYQTLDELYQVVVTSNNESYEHEDNIDESLVPVIEEDEEEEEIIGEEGIIFPNSSDEEIASDVIEGLSDEELRYAINELYARHGYSFKDDELKEFYSKYEWYEASVIPDDFSMDLFNGVEKKNVESLQEERSSRN